MQQNLYLAEELGAKVVNVTSESVAQTVIEYARQKNITKIIAGKPLRPRWMDILRGSVIDQIIRNSGLIDIYVVSEKDDKAVKSQVKEWVPHRPIRRYFFAIGLVILFTVAGLPLHPILDPTNLVMLYLASVVIAGVFLGRGPAIFGFFSQRPGFRFHFRRSALYLHRLRYPIFPDLHRIATGWPCDQQFRRHSARSSRCVKGQRTAGPGDQPAQPGVDQRDYTASGDDLHCSPGQRIIFNREVIILLPENGRLVQEASTQNFNFDQNELAVAEWAFKNKQPAGQGTDTLPPEFA